jgi:hypothetical protein
LECQLTFNVELFAGAGGFAVAELLITISALIVWRVLAVVMPYVPATIWALRAPKDSPHYRCPPLPGGRPSLSGLLRKARQN